MCIQGHFKYLAFSNSHFCTLSPPCTHPLPSHLLPSQNKILPHLCLPLFFSMNEWMMCQLQWAWSWLVLHSETTFSSIWIIIWKLLMSFYCSSASCFRIVSGIVQSTFAQFQGIALLPLLSSFFLPHVAVENIVSFLFVAGSAPSLQ